ncbi:GAF domain-containing protein [Spirochaeta dissipatitropha]
MNKTTPEYNLILRQLNELIKGESNLIANLANISALLNQALPDINWAGFYVWEESSSQLVLGPFQGQPACLRIPIGKGVCGTAAEKQKTILVDDVHAFQGHIACDSRSSSEIVVPLLRDGRLLGVLDIDSPLKSRFKTADAEFLEACAAVICSLDGW